MSDVDKTKRVRKSKRFSFLKIVFNNNLEINCFKINMKLM